MAVSDLIKQKSYEKIEYVLRRHPLVFLPIIFLFLVLAVVPGLVYFLLSSLYPALFLKDVFFTLGILLASIYYLSIYLFFYAQFIDYYLDIWVVTNDRIIDTEQKGLFSRSTTEMDLFRIQDVTANTEGVFRTLFHFGDVIIKTASTNTNIIFKDVLHPNEIREQLVRLSHEDRIFHQNQ